MCYRSVLREAIEALIAEEDSIEEAVKAAERAAVSSSYDQKEIETAVNNYVQALRAEVLAKIRERLIKKESQYDRVALLIHP